ncbi:MAG: SMR family transporter [Candidatus Peregrinibacteria bacterium]|nr:SMR family transporter [Candidatus Peregrinibacteria bacterium]
MFWIYLTATLVFDVVGMTFAKKYVLYNQNYFFVLALLSFLAVGFFMIQMLRFEGIAIANAIWAGMTVTATLLIGILYFKEQVSLLQIIGIMTVLVGIVMVEWK